MGRQGRLGGHLRRAIPALLKTALHQLSAGAQPTLLGHVLQVVQHLLGMRCMVVVFDPHLGQALIRRQFPRSAAEILTLHTGCDAFGLQRIDPKRGDETIGGLGNALHGRSIAGISATLWGMQCDTLRKPLY